MTAHAKQSIPERLQRLRERLETWAALFKGVRLGARRFPAVDIAILRQVERELAEYRRMLALIDAQGPVIERMARFWPINFPPHEAAIPLLTALETAVDDLCGPAGRDGGMVR